MQNGEAVKILARHLMQCGALMPIEWVQKNGEGSEFMQAYEMAINALKNEPVPCKDCRNCTPNENTIGAYGYCYHFGCYDHEPMVEADDFCSYGERREGE